MFDLLTSFSAKLGDAYQYRDIVIALVEAFNSDVFPIFPAKARLNKKKVELTLVDDLTQHLGDSREFELELVRRKAGRSAITITIEVTSGQIDVEILASENEFGSLHNNIFISQAAVFESLIAKYGDQLVVSAYCGSSVRNLSFVRVRPPRDFEIVDPTSIVDIVDTKYFHNPDQKAFAQKLFSKQLPEKTSRANVGGVAIICWHTDPAITASSVAISLTKRDIWLHETGIGKVKEGWNQYGDVVSDPIGAMPHKDVTLYSPVLETAYQAVHSASSTEDQRRALEKLATLLKSGQLADGSNLVNAIIVADSRKQALKILGQAKTKGIGKALYPANDHLWDPDPNGEWLEQD